MDKRIEKEIRDRVENGTLSCASAFQLAASLNAAPQAVGKAADDLGISLSACALGLFGYVPNKKIVAPEKTENQGMLDAIMDVSQAQGLDCADAWKIARDFGVPRLTVGNVCEAEKIKIRNCQLGAF